MEMEWKNEGTMKRKKNMMKNSSKRIEKSKIKM